MKNSGVIKKRKIQGFTLVEILVVMAIIATISTISLVALNKVVQGGREKITETRIKALDMALKEYFADDPSNSLEDELLESANGDGISSKELYAYLSGDEDGDGKLDGDYEIEAVYLKELLPPLDSDGNFDFDNSACWVKPVARVGTGPWQVVEIAPTDDFPSDFAIVDGFNNPIRFFHRHNRGGNKNEIPRGFDIWSGGRDGVTEDDSDENPTAANKMLDDIKNW